jgi:hypothetical protein
LVRVGSFLEAFSSLRGSLSFHWLATMAPKAKGLAKKAVAVVPMKAMKAMKAMKSTTKPSYKVTVKGTVYTVPGSIPKKHAKRVKMIEISTKNLPKIYVPLTEAEAVNKVDPEVYSESLGMRIKTKWDNKGCVVWGLTEAFHKTSFGTEWKTPST